MRWMHVRLLIACGICVTTAAITRSSSSRVSTALTVTQSEAFELDAATIAQMQEWMAKGRYSSRQLTELYLRRIDRIDRSGPELRSISETNQAALAIADTLDA